MNEEKIKKEAHEVMELGKHIENLHHKKGFGGLLFIDLSMIKFSTLTRYIRLLEQENQQLKEDLKREIRVRDEIHNLLHNRIDKAIEYMNNNKIDNYEVDGTPLFCGIFNELLEILKGDNNE